MPRLVDHDERRRTIVAAAWRLIADRGIDGINMRDLATEAGYTNGALSHYFSGKDEILRTAFEYVIDATNQRIDTSVGDGTGGQALRRLCIELMPLTDEARLEARIAVSLWQRAMTDAGMAAVNNLAVADWKRRMATYWREAIDDGELPSCEVDAGVEVLMTAIIGLQVSAVLDRSSTSRATQLALLDTVLATPAE
ncbi:TetR/AcrR family transcriptional regulator [Gordonia insulae]|uniref:HTH-type transcriptional regulator RcdA n=1 Tax=Gordonia insulae TaxID=2420509 RepID=A0A3G8JPQ2_9ACTN|nr:TetR/AcrR family transcriptional regulator [Gordonia insulae]AZG46665.1 HTH-type transcriptional regulator RcdA [Gordonia insulae]